MAGEYYKYSDAIWGPEIELTSQITSTSIVNSDGEVQTYRTLSSDAPVIILSQDLADQLNETLIEAAKTNLKVKEKSIIYYVLQDNNESALSKKYKYITAQKENLLSWFSANDANKLSQTDEEYDIDNPSKQISKDRNIELKLRDWAEKELITSNQFNEIIETLVLASSTVHNDWVYSLTGSDSGRSTSGQNLTIDIHDRRLDDPNNKLVIQGGAYIGNPDNPYDRKSLSILGETEGQDATVFGRLLDIYGESNPKEFGHQIPDTGKYPKVFINRGEDRYNAEVWDDNTYGLGFGTIEANKEIVSHTTVSADRGIIIEDGKGDSMDKEVVKYYYNNETSIPELENYTDLNNSDIDKSKTYYVSEKHKYYKFFADEWIIDDNYSPKFEYGPYSDNKDHDTNGFALQIHHDGMNIKGHSYIADEIGENIYYYHTDDTSTNKTVYRPNASIDTGEEAVTVATSPTYFFCTGREPENYYKHYCMNKNGRYEPVIDQWPGHLYYEKDTPLEGQEGHRYCTANGDYYYDGSQYVLIKNYNDDTFDPYEGQIYKYTGTQSTTLVTNEYYKRTIKDSKYTFDTVYSTDDLPNGYVNKEGQLYYKRWTRVIPKTGILYKLEMKDTYKDTQNGIYKLLENLDSDGKEIGCQANDIVYWDGTHYKVVKPLSYNIKQDYGSLTIGTRFEDKIQDEDTIGRHSIEIGTNNLSSGNNSITSGEKNTIISNNSIASGKENNISSTGAIDSQVFGYMNNITGAATYSSIFGVGNTISAAPQGVFVSGGKNVVEIASNQSHIEGAENTLSNTNSAVSTTSRTDSYSEGSSYSHLEGHKNTVQKYAVDAHIEGHDNLIKSGAGHAHVEGEYNIADEEWQHVQGVYNSNKLNNDSKTKYYTPTTTNINGESRRDNSQLIDIVGNGSLELDYDENGQVIESTIRSNAFTLTKNGTGEYSDSLIVNKYSDLRGLTTIGDALESKHSYALEVLGHSKLDQEVLIERDQNDSSTANGLDENIDNENHNSLKVRGTSLFNDKVTIGYDGDQASLTGSFWSNLNDSDAPQCSEFTGLEVHGEIKNERIPDDLYTSMDVNGVREFNQFADKFFVNSSIASNTATFRGTFTPEDYARKQVEEFNFDSGDGEVNYNIIEYDNFLPCNYTNQLVFDYYDEEINTTSIDDYENPIIGKIYKFGGSLYLYISRTEGTEVVTEYKLIGGTLIHLTQNWKLTEATESNTYEQEKFPKTYYSGYYKYTYEDEEKHIIPTDKDQMSKWLNKNVFKFSDDICELVTSWDNLTPTENKIYHNTKTDEYRQWAYKIVEKEDGTTESKGTWAWNEVNPWVDKNDYCFIEIWEPAADNGVVLYTEKLDAAGHVITENAISPESAEGEMNIVCHRYKFVETTDPQDEDTVLEKTWKFEYQLNNSSFTQAQWNAINSGISAAWMVETRQKISDEVNRATKEEESLFNDIINVGTDAVKGTAGGYNRPVYIGATTSIIIGDSDERSSVITYYNPVVCDYELSADVTTKNTSSPLYLSAYDDTNKQYVHSTYICLPDYTTSQPTSTKIIATEDEIQGIKTDLKNYIVGSETGSTTQPVYIYKDSTSGDYKVSACDYNLYANVTTTKVSAFSTVQDSSITSTQNPLNQYIAVYNANNGYAYTDIDIANLATVGYVNDKVENANFDNYVTLDGNQNIIGQKTFNSGIILNENKKGSILTSAADSAGTFTLPNVSTGGELALKTKLGDWFNEMQSKFALKVDAKYAVKKEIGSGENSKTTTMKITEQITTVDGAKTYKKDGKTPIGTGEMFEHSLSGTASFDLLSAAGFDHDAYIQFYFPTNLIDQDLYEFKITGTSKSANINSTAADVGLNMSSSFDKSTQKITFTQKNLLSNGTISVSWSFKYYSDTPVSTIPYAF